LATTGPDEWLSKVERPEQNPAYRPSAPSISFACPLYIAKPDIFPAANKKIAFFRLSSNHYMWSQFARLPPLLVVVWVCMAVLLTETLLCSINFQIFPIFSIVREKFICYLITTDGKTGISLREKQQVGSFIQAAIFPPEEQKIRRGASRHAKWRAAGQIPRAGQMADRVGQARSVFV